MAEGKGDGVHNLRETTYRQERKNQWLSPSERKRAKRILDQEKGPKQRRKGKKIA